MVFKSTKIYQKQAIGAGLIFVLLTAVAVRGNIFQHQWPDIPESSEFKVWVNGTEMFTGLAGDKRWQYSFCAFDFTQAVTVRVRFNRAIKWVDIMPSVLGIEHTSINDNTFEFTLHDPKKITIVINNDRKNTLHVLTNLPEKKRPNPKEAVLRLKFLAMDVSRQP